MGPKNRLLKNVRKQIQAANQREVGIQANGTSGGKRWQDELRALKLADMEKRFPSAFLASGGYNQRIKPYSDTTSNGLTKCILDFLNFSGHWAVRVNVQGQARVQRIPKFNILSGQVEQHEKVQWTKSMTKRGTPDIDSIIFGKPAKIEVKIKGDQIRDEQTEQGQRIEAAGGLWYIARDMPSLMQWYRETFVTSDIFNKK